MNLYRGYVELDDNKKSKTSYKKGKPLYTYDQVKNTENFAGVLADDAILIDVDDEDQSLKLKSILQAEKVNTKIIKTTRGRHFLFKNTQVRKCYTHTMLAVSIIADIKVGSKNTYEVLKFHGVERSIEQDFIEDASCDLPDFLLPVTYAPEFLSMQEGDGRNQNLFNYILELQKLHLSIDSIRHILTLINTHILQNPLSESELNLLMRDEAFNKPIFFDGKRFLHEVFGDYLINNHHIKRINGLLHAYKHNVYIPDTKYIEKIMLSHIKDLNHQRRMEVLKYLSIQCDENTEMSPANLILFKNGIYDIKTGEFMEPNPSFIITNQIPHNYNPKSYSPIVDEVLDNLADGNHKTRFLLEEMIGFCMYRRSEDGRCFILKGKKSNGKSTLLEAIRVLLGDDNTCSLDLNELDDRFSTIMLHNKLANIGDDINDEYIPSTGVFKKVVTGNRIAAEAKGVDKTEFNPYCKLIFSANNIPRIGRGKDSQAIARRMVIVPLTACFEEASVISKNNAVFKPYIIDELKSENAMEYLILLALKGLKRWIDTNKFTIGDNVENALDEFKHDNNPLLGFFEELQEEGLENSLDDQRTNDVYTKYNTYCQENGYQALGKNWFVRQLLEYFSDFESVRVGSREEGKSIKIPKFRKKR